MLIELSQLISQMSTVPVQAAPSPLVVVSACRTSSSKSTDMADWFQREEVEKKAKEDYIEIQDRSLTKEEYTSLLNLRKPQKEWQGFHPPQRRFKYYSLVPSIHNFLAGTKARRHV